MDDKVAALLIVVACVLEALTGKYYRSGHRCYFHLYQLYAKPSWFDCYGTGALPKTNGGSIGTGTRQYLPPTTDIRPLEQTMYIPVIPTKPGGEREVTFPMTPRTLGQPDVTTSCCVPVLPCQPGFRNLTPHIKPTSAEICSQGNFCSARSGDLAHHTCKDGGSLQCCDGGLVPPPNNLPGDAFVGVPDTFPAVGMRQELPVNQEHPHQPYAVPRPPPSSGMPNLYTSGQPQGSSQQGKPQHRVGQSLGGVTSRQAGHDECGGKCVPHLAVKKTEVSARDCERRQETNAERQTRLTTMFGSYGSYLQVRPMPKRFLPAAQTITSQGNGFHWDAPQNDANLCYIMEQQQS